MSRRAITSLANASRYATYARSLSSSPLLLGIRPVGPCPICDFSTATTTTRSASSTATRLAPTLDRTPPSTGTMPPPLPSTSTTPQVTKPKSRVAKPRKAAISLSSTAVDRVRSLLDSPEPKLIRIGVRNKGCAGMSYHLEYVDKPDRFDEVVEQDGVKVVIDSKALFSIIGSTMDWQEDALQAKFVFNNPNIKDACGCGESFIV